MTLAEVLLQLFPAADPLRDYVVQDDGRGAYIAAWHLSEPRPTVAELAALGVVEGVPVARENDFITEARAATRAIWDGVNKLKALQREYNALDYGTTLDVGVGENAGITKEAVGAVVFDTCTALEGVLAAGHATNMARLL